MSTEILIKKPIYVCVDMLDVTSIDWMISFKFPVTSDHVNNVVMHAM